MSCFYLKFVNIVCDFVNRMITYTFSKKVNLIFQNFGLQYVLIKDKEYIYAYVHKVTQAQHTHVCMPICRRAWSYLLKYHQIWREKRSK